jgi:hypothetical protein
MTFHRRRPSATAHALGWAPSAAPLLVSRAGHQMAHSALNSFRWPATTKWSVPSGPPPLAGDRLDFMTFAGGRGDERTIVVSPGDIQLAGAGPRRAIKPSPSPRVCSARLQSCGAVVLGPSSPTTTTFHPSSLEPSTAS